ncbi:MAG: hypothetical protein ACI8S6_001934 [Myxococcota bacterium]|jgi:hypothetical protein
MRTEWFWNIAARDLMNLAPGPRRPGALAGASTAQLCALCALCALALASAWTLGAGSEVEALAVLSALR